MKKTKLTIQDIAKLANVHKSTVSRALNNSEKIKPETKRKIEEIIRNHNYIPNSNAKALATGTSNNIAIIIPERTLGRTIQSSIVTQAILGIGTVASKYSYNVVIINSYPQTDQEYVSLFQKNEVSGIISISSGVNDTFPYLFRNEHIPHVNIGHFPDPTITNCIYSDSELGGFIGADFLLSHGHRKLLILGGNENFYHNHSRLIGVQKAFLKHRENFDKNKVIFNQTSIDRASQTFQTIIQESKTLPDAVFCFTDTAAMAVNETAYQLGISIPDEISLIGYGNHFFTEFMRPKLTTINEELGTISEKAMEILISMLKSKEQTFSNVSYPPSLVVRDSVQVEK